MVECPICKDNQNPKCFTCNGTREVPDSFYTDMENFVSSVVGALTNTPIKVNGDIYCTEEATAEEFAKKVLWAYADSP